jgi:hypothetical protein
MQRPPGMNPDFMQQMDALRAEQQQYQQNNPIYQQMGELNTRMQAAQQEMPAYKQMQELQMQMQQGGGQPTPDQLAQRDRLNQQIVQGMQGYQQQNNALTQQLQQDPRMQAFDKQASQLQNKFNPQQMYGMGGPQPQVQQRAGGGMQPQMSTQQQAQQLNQQMMQQAQGGMGGQSAQPNLTGTMPGQGISGFLGNAGLGQAGMGGGMQPQMQNLGSAFGQQAMGQMGMGGGMPQALPQSQAAMGGGLGALGAGLGGGAGALGGKVMKKGGAVKAKAPVKKAVSKRGGSAVKPKTSAKKMASGGSTSPTSKRGDGVASKGKTRCKMY